MELTHSGRLFAFECQDGGGKKTQLELLKSRLMSHSYKVSTFSLPNYGKPSAWGIEQYLAGALGKATNVDPYIASTLYAHDRFFTSRTVSRCLYEASRNSVVLLDRWVLSNLAHQGTKVSLDRFETFSQWLHKYEHQILEAPRPFYLILNVPPEISFEKALERAAGRQQDGHEVDFYHICKAREIYVRYAETYPESSALIECAKDSKTLLSPDVIHERVWQVVQRHLQ